jgi:hypothetical protein
MGAFASGLAAAGLLEEALGRDPREHDSLDLATLAAATFKASRTITGDEVTSLIREPFTEGRSHEGGEEPVERGDLRQAIGEQVTCTRCIGTWVAAGLATTQILMPRFGRMLTWALAGAGVNDFLKAGFTALTHIRTSSSSAACGRSGPLDVRLGCDGTSPRHASRAARPLDTGLARTAGCASGTLA